MRGDALTFPLVPRCRIDGLPFGGMRSARRGGGSDLAGFRPYRPGDDVRRIDWRASARLSLARTSDEFVVREHFTEQATRVVLVVDRSPRMALFPASSPWLHKPAAVVAAGRMIVDSSLVASCLVGYLDDADALHPRLEKRAESPFWRPPRGQDESSRITERYLPYPAFHGPEDSLARALAALDSSERALPAGSFVFVLSDFLAFPPEHVWRAALARGWELVPVVVQDPVWEQSFPDVAGVVLPVADVEVGGVRLVRLRRSEVERRRHENEARLEDILDRLDGLGLDAVLLSRADPVSVYEAFGSWAEARERGTRVGR